MFWKERMSTKGSEEPGRGEEGLEERVERMVHQALTRCIPQILHDLKEAEREEERRSRDRTSVSK